MTDEVGALVLRDNVLQNLALSHDRGSSGRSSLDAAGAADAQAGGRRAGSTAQLECLPVETRRWPSAARPAAA